MTFEIGRIVLVRFPFTDQLSSKRRPAVVVSRHSYNEARPDVILMPVSSRIRATLAYGETLLTDWREAGLLKPSVVKPVLATFDQRVVTLTLGRLQEPDLTALLTGLADLLG